MPQSLPEIRPVQQMGHLQRRPFEAGRPLDDHLQGMIDQIEELAAERLPAAGLLQRIAKHDQPVAVRRKLETQFLELARHMTHATGLPMQPVRVVGRGLGIDYQDRFRMVSEKRGHRIEMAADFDNVRAIAHEIGCQQLPHGRCRACQMRDAGHRPSLCRGCLQLLRRHVFR